MVEGPALDCDRCGKCCIGTSMQLSLNDIRRLEKLGYERGEFTIIKDGFYTMKNRKGACCFFDKKSKCCRVYAKRPEGCRYYPMMYSLYEKQPIIDEKECHNASTITEHELKATTPRLVRLIERIVKDSPKRDK
jgi:Fe-S-cluster containining protein